MCVSDYILKVVVNQCRHLSDYNTCTFEYILSAEVAKYYRSLLVDEHFGVWGVRLLTPMKPRRNAGKVCRKADVEQYVKPHFSCYVCVYLDIS